MTHHAVLGRDAVRVTKWTAGVWLGETATQFRVCPPEGAAEGPGLMEAVEGPHRACALRRRPWGQTTPGPGTTLPSDPGKGPRGRWGTRGEEGEELARPRAPCPFREPPPSDASGGLRGAGVPRGASGCQAVLKGH